ncbi:MAG: alkaline phosphatase [Candidatus Poribacteria bacterium]|nr:alkaline phosphatase [Candidatus Poribacteria bacterium]
MCISLKKRGVFGVFGVILLVGSLFFGFTLQAVSEVLGVKHVVIIGCDGMSPDGIQKAKTPNMDALMQRGAYTMRARAVMPTSSSPNWASMLMGAGPEQHGVTSNDWRPDKFALAPTAVGSGGIFPTIFSVLRAQQPSAVIACFHDWGGIGHLFEREALDIIEDTDGPVNTTERAVAYFKAKQPDFTFIHLDHIDHAGHKYGYRTSEYYKSVEEADRLIGEAIQGLEAAGILAQTILIITSDHGGVGKGHGGATLAEVEIPWIIAGPGVAPAKELTSFVNIYDTAATAAHIFGLTAPDCWIAEPVLEAFGSP